MRLSGEVLAGPSQSLLLFSLCFFLLTSAVKMVVTFPLPLHQLEGLLSSPCSTGHAAAERLLWGPQAKSPSSGQAPRGLPNAYNDFQKIIRCKQTTVLFGKHCKPRSSPMGHLMQSKNRAYSWVLLYKNSSFYWELLLRASGFSSLPLLSILL